jgi:hypothetical protein
MRCGKRRGWGEAYIPNIKGAKKHRIILPEWVRKGFIEWEYLKWN